MFVRKVNRTNRGFGLELALFAIAKFELIQREAEMRTAFISRLGQRRYFALTKRNSPNLCSRAESLKHSTGEKSAQHIEREREQNNIKEAASWRDLHEGLVAEGLILKGKDLGEDVAVCL